MPTLKMIFTVQLSIVAACAVGILIVAPQQLWSFLAGAGTITLNFVFLAAFWKGVLDKKSVARTILLVVIKYALLGVLLYIFVKELRLPLMPFFVGVTTLGCSFMMATLQAQLTKRSE